MRNLSTRRNLIANFVGQGVSAVANIVFIPVYIAYMGIEAYGLVGVFAILTASLSMLDASFGSTLNRQFALRTTASDNASADGTGDLLRSLEWVCAVVLVTATVIAIPVSVRLASHWSSSASLPAPVVERAIVLMTICAVLRLSEGLYRGAILGLHRHVVLNAIVAGIAVLRALGAIAVLRWIAPSIDAFFIWQALVSMSAVLAFAVATYSAIEAPQASFRFSANALRLVWRFAAGILITSISGFALTQLDKMLLLQSLPLEQFGYYALAVSASSALYQIVTPVVQSYFPRMTRLVGEQSEPELARTYHRACQLVCISVIPVAAVLHYATGPLLSLWSHNPALVTGSGPLLAILAVGTMFHCLMHMPYMLQLAEGWTSLAAKGNLLAVALLIPALLWLVPRYGAIGAAYAWLTLNAGYILVSIPIMHRRLLSAEMARWYLTELLAPLIAVIVVGTIFTAPWPGGALLSDSPLSVATATFTFFAAVVLSVPLGREWLQSAWLTFVRRV